jgi:large-conductance mechanosensitive channel
MEIKLPTNRNFGIVFFFVFLIISAYPLLNDDEIRYWSLFISLIFLLLGLINSRLLTPLNKAWVRFGIMMGRIINPIIMSLIFFLVVTPTGYLIRLIGKDVLNLKKNDDKSYWKKKEKNLSSMKDQF